LIPRWIEQRGVRFVRLGARTAMVLTGAMGAGALAYSTIEPDWLRLLLTILFVLVVGLALAMRRLRRGVAIWTAMMIITAVWYELDKPLNNRDWAPEYRVLTTWSHQGNAINIDNVRNFSYRSDGSAIPAYYDATYRPDQVTTVDLVTSYWAGEAIAHVFLTFGFQDGRHLALSIETRRQERFPYSAIAGFFHHFELFYVVADERDLIGVRTDIRHERVYLYRLNVSQDRRTALFLSYLDAVQKLAVQPAWYNTLTDNCTTGILVRAGAKGSVRYDWRIVLSGYAAQLAYDKGLLNKSLPFSALKKASLIRRPQNAVIDSHYSSEIRHGLPLKFHTVS
jgi:hypothetical protein